MNKYRIASIPGDGIGKEIMPEGIKVLNVLADVTQSYKIEWTEFPWGSEYYLKNGEMMPADGVKTLQEFDAIYFGAVGWPEVPDHITLWGLRLPICQGFQQYANVRPALLYPGVKGPLAGKDPGAIDLVVVRENTEGEYAGVGGRAQKGTKQEVATETSVFTCTGVERVIRYAFELAAKRRNKVSSVTKSNAQRYGFVLWDEIFQAVSSEYPQIETERVLVDAMAARFVLNPESLDVVVASNLHGDILTDLGGAIVGSLGMAPSGNINPEKDYPSMFEPVHGSAPDIYGKGIANPIGMFLSGAMMLDFLGESEAGKLIEKAVRETTSQGILPPDVGGNTKTKDVTQFVIDAIKS
ncbi:MAG TPA: tartrate dehydrogenase [Anaerolineales bacterium]|nr:tartrate dehydrogenase [Anaerolineales bacterium]